MKRVLPVLLLVGAAAAWGPGGLLRASTPATVADGTPVHLRLKQTIYSAATGPGQPVQFEVVNDYKMAGDTIIRRSGAAFGIVRSVKKKGLFHGPNLTVDINSVTLADGERAPLRAELVVETGNGADPKRIDFTKGSPRSLYKRGKSITVMQGIEITAYIDGDQSIDLDHFKKPSKKASPGLGALGGRAMPAMPQIPKPVMPAKPVMPGPAAPSTPAALPPGTLSPAQQAEVSKLELQALTSTDPSQQVQLCSKVLALEPTNTVAANCLKDAQAKLQAQQAAQTQQQNSQTQQAQQAETLEQQKRNALAQSQTAYLAGNLPLAASQLAIAQKIDPTDPEALRLASLIKSAQHTRWFIHVVLIVAGVVALILAILLLLMRRGKKEPYLEIVDGVDQGQRFKIDREVIHVGAVAQDGGNKNEVVVRDPERTISRFHCEIYRQKGKLHIADCQSANGTYLNGKLLPPGKLVRLRNGARVRLAEGCTLRIGFEKKKVEKET